MKLRKILMVVFAFLLLVSASVGYAETFRRMITNQTDVSWLISHSGGRVIFDNPDDGRNKGPACLEKHDGNGVVSCLLPPGKTTFVLYWLRSREYNLVFSHGLQHKPIIVRFRQQGELGDHGVWMKSSDETRINDNHGDIYIFPGANR